VASVAADPSAIAPPLPLPSRPDAAPAAGPSGAFADMLNASAAPAPAPQPQGTLGARPDDGSNAGQTGGPAGSGSSDAAAAGVGPTTAATRNGKGPGDSKSADALPNDANSAGNAAANITVVAGLAVPPFAVAPLPAANQTPAPSQDTQAASADAATPAQDGTGGPPGDHKDSDAPSDPIAAGIAAAIPALVPVVTVVAPASSAPAGTNPVGSLPSGANAPAGPSPAASAGAPSTDSNADVAQSSAQPPNGTSQSDRPASTSVLDLLTAMQPAASAASEAGELQTAVLPAPASTAANSGASDRNAPSASPPVITPDARSATPTPAAEAALNPPVMVTAPVAANQVAADIVTNTELPRDAAPIATTLPTQIAIRFATPAHADDEASSDNGSDVLRGASIGGTAPPGSGQPGTAIIPGFAGILSTMQTAPSTPTVPQHAAATTDAVTLAAVPIAIVARAEAGERRFEIRLDPPDLGRIDVQLNVDSSGRATSHLVVDRASTLDLLRRDAPALERALQSAGLTTDNGSLQFSLRDQSFAGREQALPAPVATPAATNAGESEVAPIDTALRRYGTAAGLGGGIDIRV
jgi:flagellar hook-length control protein FliK